VSIPGSVRRDPSYPSWVKEMIWGLDQLECYNKFSEAARNLKSSGLPRPTGLMDYVL